MSFLKSVLDSKEKINVYEVFVASIIAFLIGVLMVFIINKKLMYKLANKLKISSSHGDSDVWEYVFDSETVEWINIRENNLIYQGKVLSYSEKDNKRELFISQVKVFSEDDTSQELYEMPFMYFNFDVNSNIIIEIN